MSGTHWFAVTVGVMIGVTAWLPLVRLAWHLHREKH